MKYDDLFYMRMFRCTTNFTFDANNQLLNYTSPARQESYTYSDGGNLLTKTVPDVGTSTYTYNAMNELQTITGSGNYSFTYDDWGNMTAKTTPQGNFSLSWNDADQLTHVSGPSKGDVGCNVVI